MLDENPYRPHAQETPLAVVPKSAGPASGKTGWLWILMGCIVAAATGVAGRLIRPRISGPVHYEAIATLAPMIIVCVVLLVRFRGFFAQEQEATAETKIAEDTEKVVLKVGTKQSPPFAFKKPDGSWMGRLQHLSI